MRKIPTVFVRDEAANRRYVRNEVVPEAKWVLDGEGVATRKYDGTCVMLDADGEWWARREVKPGKSAPAGFEPISTDEVTGKTVGWEPIGQSSFAKFHAEAVTQPWDSFPPGTYELCGPKINGNPEGFTEHVLIHHETAQVIPLAAGLTFDSLRERLTSPGWQQEGIVWHHPDGRMAKLKKKDFPQ